MNIFMTELNAKFDKDEITALQYIREIETKCPENVVEKIDAILFLYNVSEDYQHTPICEEEVNEFAIYLSTLFSGDDCVTEDLINDLDELYTKELDRIF